MTRHIVNDETLRCAVARWPRGITARCVAERNRRRASGERCEVVLYTEIEGGEMMVETWEERR